jgi:hypothetical protein
MNRSLLGLLIVSLYLAPDATAQFRLGAILDLNLASVNIDPEPEARSYEGSVRFGIGGVADYALTDQLDVHAQLMLQGKGNKIVDEDFENDLFWRTSYIEVPVLLRYRFTAKETVHPYVMAGLNVGFLTKAEFTMEGEPDQEDEDAESLDFGISVGAGAQIPRGRQILFAEIRYVHGLVNVVDSSGLFDVKNRGLMILAGFTLPTRTR